ncbi:MAG: hypothetical protein H6754_01835 [Candidatus Omnitrophica bacterium]|nr:hypothetical protein [Candidatus Omnitrophota bacterium]
MFKKLILGMFIFLLTSVASADVLVFKSGKTVEGLITKVTETGITFQSGNDTLGVSYTQIKDIRESTGPNARNSPHIAIARGDGVSQASAGTQTKKVVVYMTSWCGYCRKMTAFLKQNGIAYTAHDIEKNDMAKKMYQKYGGQGVPLVIVGEKVIRGYNPDGVVAALR